MTSEIAPATTSAGDGLDAFGVAPGTGTARIVRPAATPEAATLVRGALAADLAARGVDPAVIDDARLVVTELVANAVRHAAPLTDGCVRVRWRVQGETVDIEVGDGGAPTTPRPSPLAPWATQGRGLRIVRSVAHEWGVLDDPHGRIVWACVGGPSRRRVTT